MKRFISLVVMSLVALLPFGVDAATNIAPSCSAADENGVITCTISYKITDQAGVDNLSVTLTENGGAEIVSINDAEKSDWSVSSKDKVDGVWTILLVSPGVDGEGSLFTFQYQASGKDDCKVVLSLNNETVNITPEKNPETGATLPYIALGIIALGATGAYIATKNKGKMYRI